MRNRGRTLPGHLEWQARKKTVRGNEHPLTDLMKTTRRHFFNSAALTGVGLALTPWQRLAGQSVTQGDHHRPRGLLYDEGDLKRIREAVKHPRFAPLWEEISALKTAPGSGKGPIVGDGGELAQVGAVVDLDADTRFLRDELNVQDHVRHMLRARRILERSAFVHFVSGDPGHLAVALLAVEKLLQYPKWDYFLEGRELTIGLQRAPEATIAMSLALQWLDKALDPAIKAEMKKQIAEKGAPACYQSLYSMRYPDRVRGWTFDPASEHDFTYDMSRWPIILNSTNLKVIPIAGLAMAACVLKDDHPQAPRWLDMAIQSARAFAPMYGSDGSYDEGISYWGYTTLHLALFAECVYRVYGIDERDIIDFGGTVRHALQMSMPTVGNPNDAVNFGDAKTIGDISAAGWIAALKNDGLAQHILMSVGDIRSQYGIGWFHPKVKPVQPGPELLDVRFVNDWVLSRTGWDEQSSQVAFRSGGPANHEHADRNSVIFKAYGERLLHDPFNAAYMPTLPLWKLRQTAAHTAVLIDGRGHQYHDGSEGTNASWAEARIIDYSADANRMIATSEATQAYRLVNDNVAGVFRTVLFLKPDILVLYDKVILRDKPVPIQVRFQVFNDDQAGQAETTGASFLINRPQARLTGFSRSLAPGLTVRANTLDILPGKAADTFIGMEENLDRSIGEYPFVEVADEPALEHRILTVCAAPRQGGPSPSLQARHDGHQWHRSGQHTGRTVDLRLRDSGEVPEVSIT